MWKVFLWLLPIADIFKLENILSYYSSLGVDIPYRHAQYGMIERWVGYLPTGFLLGYLLSLKEVAIIVAAILGLLGPIELYLMNRGVGPWGFFRKKQFKIVAKIFLLEAYNVVGYILLGAVIGLTISA